MKRKDYISWDEYFMGIAILAAERSKDPTNHIGACIVDQQKKVIGIGYNGFPMWCSDEEYPREKSENKLEDKRTYVVHAEVNAIVNSTKNLTWCTMYVKLFPCNECAKFIIQSGIKKIIYLSDEDSHKDHNKAAKKMFKSANIEMVLLVPERKKILLDFTKFQEASTKSES